MTEPAEPEAHTTVSAPNNALCLSPHETAEGAGPGATALSPQQTAVLAGSLLLLALVCLGIPSLALLSTGGSGGTPSNYKPKTSATSDDGPGLFDFLFDSTKNVAIDGDTAKLSITIHHGVPFGLIDNLGNASFEVAQKVYDVAKKNPNVRKVEVTLKMSKQGLQDRYGNPWADDREMGVLTETDLTEIRKFVDAQTYAVDPAVRASYKYRIGMMNHAEVLK